jgi:hypothetical protein
MISVYLYEADGRLIPEWVAYASHDFHGSDLRRRWDDSTDLELESGHPVVYAGAGSHASYFRHGEYQAEVPVPAPRRVKQLAGALSGFWRETLGQGDETRSPLRIPFIDFARGDGLGIGPGQASEWTLNVIDDTTPWVHKYRGLWGLYAQDPISGENAPAGPMYERNGSPRPSWFDPLGFAGLDQVPPPPEELAVVDGERARLEARRGELDLLIAGETEVLRELGVRLQSMLGSPHLAAQSARLEAQVAEQAAMLTALRKERSENEDVLEGLTRRLERRSQGRADHPRAHIRNAAEPVAVSTMRFNRAAELWAALSISLLLIGLAVLILAAPGYVWGDLVVLLIAFVVGESILRGTFARTINRVAVILALIAVGVLFATHWKLALVALLIALATFLLLQRVREVRA